MTLTHLVFFEFFPGASTVSAGGGVILPFRALIGVGK